MYVHRVILEGVPGIPNRDLTFFDEWTAKPINNVLLMGPNGTGKTTTLMMIRWLWLELSYYLSGASVVTRIYPANIDQSDLIAIELRGFIDKNLWLYLAHGDEEADRFLARISDENAAFVGEIGREKLVRLDGTKANDNDIRRRMTFRVSDNFQEYRIQIRTLLEKLQLSVSTSEILPNMVSIRSNARQLIIPDQDADNRGQSESLFRWLAEYAPDSLDHFSGNLEEMLKNLKVRDTQWFQRTLNDINVFLVQNGKRLTDFDDALRLRVESDDKSQPYYIENLSSGEQQCLILIFMVSRWLMPGGVVLIDEPDLHMHVSWQRAIIRELERLVQEKNGQLIVTSHSPTLWEDYNESQRRNLTFERVT